MEPKNKVEINLEKFRVPGAKVFSGRDRGKQVRIQSKIDEFIKDGQSIVIIIPEGIYSIIPSFFEELFINVVTELGKDKFSKRVEIVSKGQYPYERALDEAIERILRKKNALG